MIIHIHIHANINTHTQEKRNTQNKLKEAETNNLIDELIYIYVE